MSTDIATTTSLGEVMDWARAVAPSTMLPRQYQKQPANLLVAAEYADELGIGRMNALTDIYVIDGKPSLSSHLMAALVRRAGHRLRVQMSNDGTAAKAILIRSDDPDFEFTAVWTMQRAQAAGLTSKAVWKSYPAAMLKARAISEVVREGASEVLSGALYVPEELGASVDQDGRPDRPEPIPATVTVEALTGHHDEPADEPADPETGVLFEDPEPAA